MYHCLICTVGGSVIFSLFDRKVEDLQFSVEEACITRGDLEVTCGCIIGFSIKHILSLTSYTCQADVLFLKFLCELLTNLLENLFCINTHSYELKPVKIMSSF